MAVPKKKEARKYHNCNI